MAIPPSPLRARLGRARGKLGGLPARLIVLIFFVDLAAVTCSAIALVTSRMDGRTWAVLLLLGVLALAFEESATRIARLQWRLSADLKRDMTSVWAVAAAVALPPTGSVLLLAAVFTHIWFRQQRGTGQPLYRTFYTSCTGLLGSLAAGQVLMTMSDAWTRLPWALAGSVSVLIAIVVHTTVNRAFITLALLGVGVRGATLVGSRDDNLTELSTLCLGGLVALAALHEPWLSVLVVAPLVALQRGAFVRELEAAATTDSKTGLLNAIAWEQVAKREVARATRDGGYLSVLIIDIDRFKWVNDRFGHLVGDEVLVGIGRAIKSALREYDALGRFGGEEFVAVLPEAGGDAGLVIAERIRERINRLTVGSLTGDVPGAPEHALSVSIGVASRPADGNELAELLHSADQALYQAKAAGRNRVVVARRGGDEAEETVVVA